MPSPTILARRRALLQAFTRWDRTTAWACAQRGVPFDPEAAEVARKEYFAALDQAYAITEDPPNDR